MANRLLVLVALSCLVLGSGLRADDSHGQVYLTGEVRKEGAIVLSPEGLTAVKAIIAGGGLGDLADKKNIKVLRSEGSTTKIIVVDWNKILNGHLEDDVTLLPGDIIVVPKKLVNY